MALREVLAFLGVKVEGTEQIEYAETALDDFKGLLAPTITQVEQLRVKSAEYGEAAGRVAARIRELQRADGDYSDEIVRLRVAQQRLTAEARRYSAEATRLEANQTRTTSATRGFEGALASVSFALSSVRDAAAIAHRAISVVEELIVGVIDLGDQLDKSSQQLGVSRAALQEWRYVAERSGVEASQLDTAFMTLNRNASAAAHGGGEAVQAFRQLHVQLRGTDGQVRSTEELFEATLEALAGVTSETERAAIASRIFGESGARLLPIVNEGGEGLARLRERFRELGGGLSADVVLAAAEAQDALTDFRLASTALQGVIAVNVLPVITRLVTAFANGVAQLVEFGRTSSAVQTILGGLAVALGLLAVAALVTFPELVVAGLALAAALAWLFLVVEDVVTAFRGGDSVFGRFVERLFSAMGATLTFSGIVEAFGVAWEQATANAREGIASLLESLVSLQRAAGFNVSPGLQNAARSARREAGAARARATQSTRGLIQRERDRQAERTELDRELNAAPPVVETRQARRERQAAARGRGGGGGSTTVNAPITINGVQDPEAAARAARRELANAFRDAAETLPQAAEEG